MNESEGEKIENRPIQGSVIKHKKYKTLTQSNATSQRQMDTFCCCCIIIEDILFIHSFYLPLTVKAVFIPPHKHEIIEQKKETPTRGNSSRRAGHPCVIGLLNKHLLLLLLLLLLWVVSLVFLQFKFFLIYFVVVSVSFLGRRRGYSDMFLQVHTTVLRLFQALKI